MSTATVSLVEIAAEWRTARRLYPFYSALIREFGLNIPHCKELENPVDRSDREVLDRIHKWFAGVDGQVQVAQIRQLLQSQRFGEEESLRALLLRHLPQDQKDENLRDKLDYLLVQYFAAIAPHHPHDGDVTSSEVREALRPVLGHVDLRDVPFVKELDREAVAEAAYRKCPGRHRRCSRSLPYPSRTAGQWISRARSQCETGPGEALLRSRFSG